MGADIHFTIEHRDPHDGLGWVGVFWSDASHSPPIYNTDYMYDQNANITPEEQRRRMDHGVHPFGRLGLDAAGLPAAVQRRADGRGRNPHLLGDVIDRLFL